MATRPLLSRSAGHRGTRTDWRSRAHPRPRPLRNLNWRSPGREQGRLWPAHRREPGWVVPDGTLPRLMTSRPRFCEGKDLPGTRAAIHADGAREARGAGAVRVHDEDLHVEPGAGPRRHEVDLTSVGRPGRRPADPIAIRIARVLRGQVPLIAAIGVHQKHRDVS